MTIFPHQKAIIDALMKGWGFMRSVFGPHPRFHTGGIVPQREQPVNFRATYRRSRGRPHTDDMVQMLADFERHGYGRRVMIKIVVIDHMSHEIARITHRKEKT